MTCSHPGNRRQRILQLANSFIVYAVTLLGATKIEAQRRKPETQKRPSQGVYDLVVHCAAVLWVWMADHSLRHRFAACGRFQNALQAPRWAIDKKFFCPRCFAHCVDRASNNDSECKVLRAPCKAAL